MEALQMENYDVKEIGNISKLACRGEKEAFSAVMGLYKEEMYRIAFSYMRNEHDALEIVSETVYKAFISIKKVKNPEFLKTWVIRILINNANNLLKKKAREKKFLKWIKNERRENDVEAELDLKNAIEKLDEKSKNIIILKYYNGLTIEHIAEIIKCPVGTVKSNLSRTLKKLKITLNGEGNCYERI